MYTIFYQVKRSYTDGKATSTGERYKTNKEGLKEEEREGRGGCCIALRFLCFTPYIVL